MKRLALVFVCCPLILISCNRYMIEDGSRHTIEFRVRDSVKMVDLSYSLPPDLIIYTRFGAVTARSYFNDLLDRKLRYSGQIGLYTEVFITELPNKKFIVRPVNQFEFVENKLFWFWAY